MPENLCRKYFLNLISSSSSIIGIIFISIIIYLGFWGENDIHLLGSTVWNGTQMSFWERWQNASVVFTVGYASLIYFILFFTSKKKWTEDLNRKRLGLVTIFAVFVPVFIAGYLHLKISPSDYISWMSGVTTIAFCYVIYDIVIMTSGVDKNPILPFYEDLMYNNLPFFLSFLLLTIFATSTVPKTLFITPPFFAGAVAFQLLASNIIFIINPR